MELPRSKAAVPPALHGKRSPKIRSNRKRFEEIFGESYFHTESGKPFRFVQIVFSFASYAGNKGILSILIGHIHFHFLQMPDITDILFNGTVGGELSAAGGLEHSHLGPALFVAVRFLYLHLSLMIGIEVL